MPGQDLGDSPNKYHLAKRIDPISEIRNAGILTSGNVYWVKDPSDDDYVTFKEEVGKENLFDTIQAAIDKCTADQNDYVMICQKKDGSAWDLTTGLNLDKDRVHLIGVSYNQNNTDYGVHIRGFATSSTDTTIDEYGLLYVTGDGCEIAGIRFSATAGTGAGGTIETGGACLSLYGQAPYVHSCAIEMTGGAWDAGTPSGAIVVGSAVHGGLIENCNIGYGTKTGAGTTAGIDFLFNNERWDIKNCIFKVAAVDADDAAIGLAPGTALGMGDVLTVENCQFNNYNSATAQASALGGTVMSGGLAHVKDCSAMYTTAMGTNALVFVSPAFAGGTINNLLQNPGIAIPGTALEVTKT